MLAARLRGENVSDWGVLIKHRQKLESFSEISERLHHGLAPELYRYGRNLETLMIPP